MVILVYVYFWILVSSKGLGWCPVPAHLCTCPHCGRPTATGRPVNRSVEGGLSAQSVLGTVRNVQEAIVGLVSVIDLQEKVEKT